MLHVANHLPLAVSLVLAGTLEWAGPPARAEPPGQAAPDVDRFGDPLPADCLARMGTARFRTGYGVRTLAFSPDGSLLASGYGDLWDVPSGRLLRTFPGGGPVAFSPNGKLLAGMDTTKAIRVWEAATGKEHRCFRRDKGDSWGNNIAFSPDGKTLASGTIEGPIFLWDLDTGKERIRLRGHEGPVFDVRFSPDGKVLMSSGEDQAVRLWDPTSGRDLGKLTEHHGSLALSPDGKRLALWDWHTSNIRIWDMDKKIECDPLRTKGGVKDLAFSPGGRHVLACDGEAARLWGIASHCEAVDARKSHRGVLCAAFSPDGKRVATAGEDGRIRLWEGDTDREVQPLEHVHEGPVFSIAVAPDGKVVASGSADETVRLWDLASGRELRAWNPGHLEVRAVAFWPRHKWLVTAGRNGPFRFWDPQTGKEERPWSDRNDSYRYHGDVWKFAFSADGKTLLVSTTWSYLVEAATGRLHREVAPSPISWTPALSPDGRVVATINVPRRTRLPPALAAFCAGAIIDREPPFALWDATVGGRLRWLDIPDGVAPNKMCFAFSPDRQTLAWAGWEDWMLWDTTTWETPRRFRLPFRGGVEAIAFSPDSRTLLTGVGDGTVCLLETVTGQERCRFDGHRGAVRGVAFTPDGRFAVTGSDDSSLLVWKVRGQGLVAESRPAVHSPEEALSLWKQLGSADAASAYRAMKALARAPEQAPALLEEHIRASFRCDRAQLDRWIADLDHDEPARREAAHAKLKEAGDSAEAALRQRLSGKESVSAEQKRRIESLLSVLETPEARAARIRSLRAIEVLEWIDTAAARKVLRVLAQDAPGHWLQREVRGSLARLSREKE
jgi:WD40 repeat protein